MALYEEIARQIRERIVNGEYPPGERIPSIRHFAGRFGCNKLTVQKAFERLTAEGLLEKIVGSGSYVKFPEKIQSAGEVYDLSTDYLSESFFPHGLAGEIFQEIFKRQEGDALSAAPIAGDPGLIEVLGRFYQLPTRRMLVVSGAQQGLDLAAKVFAARVPDTILFEDPTYPGAISLFKARHFISLDRFGPRIEELETRMADGIRLFYTMPSVHNPTGISYSTARREAVARLAEAHGVFIIEDDYLSEFVDDRRPRFVDIAPARTIYVKSLSQTTVAGLRLGFMVVPASLYDRFIHAKYTSDIGSNGLMQKFFDAFVRGGGYRRFLDSLTERMQARKARLVKLLNTTGSLTLAPGQHGGSLWVQCRNRPNLPHVPWAPGRQFSFNPAMENCFRISFMALNDADFDRALEYLGRILKRLDG
ncbi:PLP-dependent aminotransferase family protein [Desulfosarcina ovata]|uniref:Transcriptional regulator n=1 Tax=Desulfosarcina ovata subsp. ovata TaxID=2752305 RepID=A0A5K8ADL3_9BACT|nr:PLP-dependent aminotransferase family protein [Desulfosarcina ovata]BBO90626.1 transcriptional regulator [Desulfosarcina ovata subsp. ovata]